MAYTAAADSSLSSLTPVPAIASLQRALLWSVGAAGAIVFVEPSPYEFATLAALIIFLATGLRLRLVFMPLLVLLFLVNIGYSIGAAGAGLGAAGCPAGAVAFPTRQCDSRRAIRSKKR